MKEGRKPEYSEITPGDELNKMPRTTTRRFKPQARLEPAQQHWWQDRKADVLTVTPRVAPGDNRKRTTKRNKQTGEEQRMLFVGSLTSQQHASVSQGRICSDNFTCCHTEKEVADQTLHLTLPQYTATGPTSPSTDPITPGVWQGSHWSANF